MHPNDDTLRDFAAGTLAPMDLLQVDEHLSVCETCRANAARLAAAADAVDRLSEGLREPAVHLTDEDLQMFVEGRLASDQAFRVRRHLADCEVCHQQADQLSAWARSRWRRPFAIGAVAAAAVLILAAVSARLWSAHEPAAPMAAAPDVMRSLSPASRAQVETALRVGAANLPPFVEDLVPRRETLMGTADSSTGFEVTAPVATAVVEDAPVFAWQALPGNGDYVVTVFDASGTEVTRSPALHGTQWIPPSPLSRDRTYTWQVSAERSGRMRIAPMAPAPPARFRVLDAATASELRQIARAYPDAHLVLGILYMQSGVRTQAISEFTQVRSDDLHADLARNCLVRLRSATPLPPGDSGRQ